MPSKATSGCENDNNYDLQRVEIDTENLQNLKIEVLSTAFKKKDCKSLRKDQENDENN